MTSIRARLIRFFAEHYFKRITPERDIKDLRDSFEAITKRLKLPKNVRTRHAHIAGIDCEWILPDGAEQAPLLYYLHGGAYLMGSSNTHRHLVAHIAKAAGVRALLPNYRLAPEHPYPAGIDDACAVYRQLLAQGEEAGRTVIGGDSAGGGLTIATLLTLRDTGDKLPTAAVLLSPWLDLSASGESMKSRVAVEPFFRPAEMPEVTKLYCRPDQVREARVSPIYAEDLSGLPRTFIQVGDHEILLSDSTRIRDKLIAAGGDVTLQVWPDMWHVFQFFVGRMPEAGKAIDAIGAFIREALPQTAAGAVSALAGR